MNEVVPTDRLLDEVWAHRGELRDALALWRGEPLADFGSWSRVSRV